MDTAHQFLNSLLRLEKQINLVAQASRLCRKSKEAFEGLNEIIAEREIFAVFPEGKKKKLRIILQNPYEVDDVSWACPVRIEGLHENLRDIIGQDSWQALELAISLVHQLLGYFLKDGGKLHWKEDGDEISLNDLFPLYPKSI